MKPKKRRRFSPEFKSQAVEMVQGGSSVQDVAADLDIEISCLYYWVRKANSQSSQLGSAGPRAEGEEAVADELRRLRAENSRLTRENTVLKKAAIILGTSHHSGEER